MRMNPRSLYITNRKSPADRIEILFKEDIRMLCCQTCPRMNNKVGGIRFFFVLLPSRESFKPPKGIQSTHHYCCSGFDDSERLVAGTEAAAVLAALNLLAWNLVTLSTSRRNLQRNALTFAHVWGSSYYHSNSTVSWDTLEAADECSAATEAAEFHQLLNYGPHLELVPDAKLFVEPSLAGVLLLSDTFHTCNSDTCNIFCDL